MEEKVKSQFFAAVTDALDKAMPVRTSDDSVLMVIADGVTASHLCGGDADTLQAVLLNFMQKNPKVAEIVCYTALGLRKSRAYKFALGQKNSTHGVATRFQKGQQPPQQGKEGMAVPLTRGHREVPRYPVQARSGSPQRPSRRL